MNPEQSAETAIFQQQINNALQNVTPRERTVFVMRHYNDFKINEIADALEVSSGTVKSLLFRALKKLRKELAPLQGNPKLEVNYE
jgi:RNA polymerase sigma-70 factor (ECF subfamily)